MSELVYVNYLKELNNNMLTHSYDLNLDFEIGSSHVMEQLGVLEQYLLLNTLELQDAEGKGIKDITGFVELSTDLWKNRYLEHKKKELKEIYKKNQLFAKGKNFEVTVCHFDLGSINEIEDELPDIDIDLFAESEEQEEDNINEGVSEEFDTELDEDLEEDITEEDTDLEEEEDEAPLLTDIFNELQQAQNLFDEEDDLDEYQDEYALVEDEEEPEESYPEDDYEQNIEEQEENTESSFDFGESSFGEDAFGMNQGMQQGFDFEQPQSPQQSQQMEQRDRVFTDAMVDKATDAVNRGLNALLKKIAK